MSYYPTFTVVNDQRNMCNPSSSDRLTSHPLRTAATAAVVRHHRPHRRRPRHAARSANILAANGLLHRGLLRRRSRRQDRLGLGPRDGDRDPAVARTVDLPLQSLHVQPLLNDGAHLRNKYCVSRMTRIVFLIIQRGAYFNSMGIVLYFIAFTRVSHSSSSRSSFRIY